MYTGFSTPPSAWWPPDRRSNCCRRGGRCTGPTTPSPLGTTTTRGWPTMADRTRAHKLADRIRVIVAEALKHRVKDPRLGFITITDARVTGDLREATVFYTVYGDETERADSAAALESVRGLLRSEVGRQTGVKF